MGRDNPQIRLLRFACDIEPAGCEMQRALAEVAGRLVLPEVRTGHCRQRE